MVSGHEARGDLEDALEGSNSLSCIPSHHDHAIAARHLDDVVARMRRHHELGEGWETQDGVVREADVGYVEVDELGSVVVAGAESHREADLPKGGGGAPSHP